MVKNGGAGRAHAGALLALNFPCDRELGPQGKFF